MIPAPGMELEIVPPVEKKFNVFFSFSILEKSWNFKIPVWEDGSEGRKLILSNHVSFSVTLQSELLPLQSEIQSCFILCDASV